jgi:hypothetical protein
MSTSRNLVRIAFLAALMVGLCWTFFARPSHGATFDVSNPSRPAHARLF